MNRGLSVCLTVCAVSCAPIPPDQGGVPLATVPIEVRHGLPTVNVKVGASNFQLFLDLGGHQGIALTTSELEQTEVRSLDTTSEFHNSKGQVLHARQFVADQVELGAFPLGAVRGGDFVMGDSVPPDRNGYIGMPVLQHYLLVFDYARKQVQLYSTGDSVALARECASPRFSVRVVNGTAVSEAATEHGKRLFIWDTGATDNFIRPSALPSTMAAGKRVDEGPPTVRIDNLIVDQVQLGPQDFRIVPFGAPAVDGYLGARLFSSHKVCIDISAGWGAIQ